MKRYSFLFPYYKSHNHKASFYLLLGRLVFGSLLAIHGLQKFIAFSELSNTFPDPLGIGSYPSLVLAIFGELCCSITFMAGFLTRLAVIPMITTMCIAFFGIHQGSIATGELSLVYMIIYLLYLVNGPGKYSIDHLISRRIEKRRYSYFY